LVADGWCWFVLREKYCWLVAGGWFVLREKYYWLVAGTGNSCGDSGVHWQRRQFGGVGKAAEEAHGPRGQMGSV
jgi:hypothetical protein